jgi:hypothetical protein
MRNQVGDPATVTQRRGRAETIDGDRAGQGDQRQRANPRQGELNDGPSHGRRAGLSMRLGRECRDVHLPSTLN